MKNIANIINRNKFLIFFLFVFGFFLIINMSTPLIGEDYGLIPLKVTTPKLTLVQTISMISSKIHTQYTQWNSRLGEQIAIVFLGFNKSIFNILNSIIATILVFVIFSYSFGRRVNVDSVDDLYALMFIFSLYICFMPRLGEITFWIAGGANYLWGVITLLLFFLPYRAIMSTHEIRNLNILPTLIFTGFGFVAGMTNENTIPVFLLLIGFMYFDFKKRKVKLPVWFFSGASALAIGYMSLILSPSTQRRINFYDELFNISDVTLVDYILRMQNVMNAFIQSSAFLLLIFLVLIGIYIVIRRVGFNNGNYTAAVKEIGGEPDNIMIVLGFVVISLISCLILIVVSYFDERAFLLVNVMIIVAATRILFQRNMKQMFLKYIRGTVVLLFAFTLWNMQDIYSQYSSFYREATARHEYILESKNKGQNSIEVIGFHTEDSRVLTTREVWLKHSGSGQYSRYYGVDEISIIP